MGYITDANCDKSDVLYCYKIDFFYLVKNLVWRTEHFRYAKQLCPMRIDSM